MRPISPEEQRAQGIITGRLHDESASSTAVSAQKVAVIRKDFNRGLLDIKDPLQSIGYNLSQFDVSSSFSVERAKLDEVIGDLYNATTYKVQYGTIPDAQVQHVEFNDIKTGDKEPPRRYVVIDRETVRGTRTSIYATFLKYGDNLYVGMDSFILGPIDVVKLIVNLFIGFLPLLWVLYARSSVAFCFFIPAVIFAAWYFRGVIISLARGDSFEVALRKNYHKAANPGTFNVADILMFYQSVLPMIINCMVDVFKKHDIPTDVLEGYVQKISYVTSITNTSGSMTIVDSAIGVANRVASGSAKK